MQILVSDHFETYNRCPRAFYYKYILGFKVFQPKNKFALGKNIHALAAYKAKGMNIDKLLENLTDEEAVQAFFALSKYEGLIPALESSHAVAFAMRKAKEMKTGSILATLSGRGDKDVDYVVEHYGYGEQFNL